MTKLEELLEKAMLHLKALTDFHEPVESASDDDVRIYWDVRVVRGSNDPFARSTGSSTMNGMLAPRMTIHAAGRIQAEVIEKIAAPMVAKFQTMMAEQVFSEPAERDDGPSADSGTGEAPSPGHAGEQCAETH